ncbi:AAA family ATPase [Methanobrevibacter sp.]|uniref:AAA family ATPase n=1 Tax=Methanobrevibacter sp. TaxID=66852 RepID=UPI003890EDC3
MVNMWMVRAGENAFLIDDFKEMNIVAIGWEIGDISGKTPDEIKHIMAKKYPEASKTSLGLNSAQVIKFAIDFEIGDYVISYNPQTHNYLVGKITSDYYFSEKLAEKYDKDKDFYHHFRDIEWIGETSKDKLSPTALRPLKSVMTIFNLNETAKNEILYKLNDEKIEWTDFYIEFADKLLQYKDNRRKLINKIQNVFNELGMTLPTLERDEEGRDIIPFDIDPFTVFALFNKQISYENRVNILNQIKKEFNLNNNVPNSFHGIATVNNLKAAFFLFSENRGENDINNLWELFEIALNYSNDNNGEFISAFNNVLTQQGIRWNITMGLNWIRPFTFINLDTNSRNLLSSHEMFSKEFRDKINSLKTPPGGAEYLQICKEVKNSLNNSNVDNFPELSHMAYVLKRDNQDDDSSGKGIGDGDVKTTKYWLISAGSESIWWEDFYKNGEVGIGFSGTGDLNQYKTKEEIKFKFQEIFNDNSSHKNDAHACWQFVHDMQIGDIIFVKNGTSEIIGRGIVESGYEYNTKNSFHNIRKVDWTHKGNWTYEKGNLITKTLTEITNFPDLVNELVELVDDGGIVIPDYPEYNLDKFLDEVYIDEKDYIILINLLKNKKNLIVEGAPGVGKTFMAKRLAYSIMGVKDSNRVMMVQFHQSYSYEDFVMGYRPSKEGFELREGSFYQFCKDAEEDSENDYFFIIDEINRGNLSKIFGELFMLIENDKRGEKNKIRLLYSNEFFFIPKNVYIIGLMNTADRSLAMIDYALRRRFAFFDLKPGFDSNGFKSYQYELENDKFNNLIEVMKELNQDIKDDESLGEGFRIGHSYLCNIKAEDVDEKLHYIVEYELIPLLKEYWFDETDKVDDWSYRLRSVINDS